MNKEQEKYLREIVFQGLGAASVCWTPWPEGIFDSLRATEIGEEIMMAITDELGVE